MRSRRSPALKCPSFIDRPLSVGELVINRRLAGSEGIYIVFEVVDTKKPRYGNPNLSTNWGNTRMRYQLISPSTGKVRTVSETELQVEWKLTSP